MRGMKFFGFLIRFGSPLTTYSLNMKAAAKEILSSNFL